MGSAIHEALAAYHRSILESRRCNKETVLGAFLKTWIEREARQKISYANGDQKDDLMEQAGELLQAYLNEPPPQGVVAVEQAYMAPLVTSDGDILEKPLVAVVDMLTREPAGLAITDFKTSGRSWSAAEADMSLQANCNVNVVKHHFGEEATFQFKVLVKTKIPKIQRVEANRTESDLGRLGDIVRTVDRAVAAEVFYPNETPMNCATCPYRQPCRDWGKPHRDAELIQLTIKTEEAAAC
jgi:hypothetical protein